MIPDTMKTQAQLIEELQELRQRVAQLEATGAVHAPRGAWENEKLLSTVFNNTSDPQLLVQTGPDDEFRVKAVNQAYIDTANLLGLNLTRENYVGITLKEAILEVLGLAQQVLDYTLNYYRQAVESGKPVEYTESFVIMDQWYHSRTRLSPILDSQGNCRYVLYTSHDVTEQKNALQAMQESEANLARAQQIAHLGNWDWDVQNQTLTWSDEVYRIFGVEQAFELSYEGIEAMIHPDDHQKNQDFVNHLRTTADSDAFEFRIVRPDGTVRHIYQNAEVQRDERGNARRIFGIMQDITERKQADEALRRLNQELEQRVEARTRKLQEIQEKLLRQERLAALGQLAGGVEHELRTPLAAITNAVYYLKMLLSHADETTQEYLEIIGSEVYKAEKIITDLLDFSRVKSLERQNIQVEDVVALVLEKHVPPDTIQVRTKIPDDLPAIVADPTHVEQVLNNLVTNACQAMLPGGTLTISAHLEGAMVAIDVSDTGHGISLENIQKLFEPLFTTKPKGIGLGLAVSKNLVEANGGSIEVRSKEGQGSTFTIYLPSSGGGP